MTNEHMKAKARQMAKILDAFADGKTIERYNAKTERWEAMTNNDSFYLSSAFNYRVRMEPEIVPYKNSDEFLEASLEHGFWLSTSVGYKYLPVNVGCGQVTLIAHNGASYKYDFETLKKEFVWVKDNAPVGKLVVS